jgi:hypothetical protein
MLPSRSNAVFHLPAEAIVVRLSSATPTNEARAARVVLLSSWIADHGGPALGATPHPQPVLEAGTVATLWPYLSSPSIPRASDLANLDTARDQPILPTGTREWLLAHAAGLQHVYDTISTPLGCGLIHADVQPDNLLHDRSGGGC